MKRPLPKRRLIACLAGALALVGPASTYAAEDIVLYHYHNGAQGPAWQEWVDEQIPLFEAQNPGIKVKQVSPAGDTSFQTLIASGTPMDVTELVLRIGASMAAQGAFMDLRPYLKTSRNLSLDDYVPIAQKAVTWTNGMVWGIPMDLYLVPTHYNVDMFSAAGLPTPASLGEGWDFDAALTSAKRMTVDRNGDGLMDQWGTHNAYTLWVYRNAFENRGAEWFDRDTDPTRSQLTSNEVVDALRWVASLQGTVADPESGSFSSAFPTGRFGWSMGTGPNTADLLNRAGANFKWGVSLPIGDVKHGAYTAVNSLQIPVTSQHPKEAWRWIEFLLTRQSSWESYIAHTSRLPAYQKYMPVWLKMIESLPNAPEGAANYINSAVRPDNYLDILSPYYAEFERTADPLIKDVLRGEHDPVTALQQLDQKMTALFASGS